MEIEYGLRKSRRNTEERGLPFSMVTRFDFSAALYQIDERYDYGEIRIQAQGLIDNRLHILVFTETERGIRVISLRKANKREIKHYEQETRS